MTSEKTADLESGTETTETTTETTATETAFGESIRNAFAALNKGEQAEEAPQEEAEAEEGEGEEEVATEEAEGETEEAEAEEEKPAAKAPPKGKRAKAEYEARIQAEREAREAREEAARLRAEFENMKKSVALLTKEPEKPQTDDDYLTSKGLDPDSFIDEQAKAAVVQSLKQADALAKDVTEIKQKTADTAFDATVRSQYATLSPVQKEEFDSAIQHTIAVFANMARVNNPRMTQEQARVEAETVLSEEMKKRFAAGENPLEWAFTGAQALGYVPGAAKATKAKKPATDAIDFKAQKEARERAGKPAVDETTAPARESGDKFSSKYSSRIKEIYGAA